MASQIKTKLSWTEGMAFSAECRGKTVVMDTSAPLGKDTGMTPKELVATGLGGCTAMDVIALLKKYKQTADKFEVTVDIEPSSGSHPIVFQDIHINFEAHGQIDPEKLKDAVKLSQTKFCGVSAMISKAAPIKYTIHLNGAQIGEGQASFA